MKPPLAKKDGKAAAVSFYRRGEGNQLVFVTGCVQHNSETEPKSCLGHKVLLLAVQALERQLKLNNQPAFLFSSVILGTKHLLLLNHIHMP